MEVTLTWDDSYLIQMTGIFRTDEAIEREHVCANFDGLLISGILNWIMMDHVVVIIRMYDVIMLVKKCKNTFCFCK